MKTPRPFILIVLLAMIAAGCEPDRPREPIVARVLGPGQLHPDEPQPATAPAGEGPTVIVAPVDVPTQILLELRVIRRMLIDIQAQLGAPRQVSADMQPVDASQ